MVHCLFKMGTAWALFGIFVPALLNHDQKGVVSKLEGKGIFLREGVLHDRGNNTLVHEVGRDF